MANVINLGSVVEMANQALPSDGDMFQCAGYYEPGDGGGGLYRFDDEDESQPNYGSVVGKFIPASPSGGAFATGRYLLVHEGFVNVRQFGALGGEDDMTLQAQSTPRWENDDHILQTYGDQSSGDVAPGTPFNGLIVDADTVDWAALQIAEIWCAENGVRLEVPSGVYMLRRPLWLGDDSTVAVDENEKDNRQLGFTMLGQTSVSRIESDSWPSTENVGGNANFRLFNDCNNRYCLSMNTEPAAMSEFRLVFKFATGDVTVSGLSVTDLAGAISSAIEAAMPIDWTVSPDVPDTSAPLSEQNLYFQINPDLTSDDPNPFLGEVEVRDEAGEHPLVHYVRCLPDCAVVSFRRSAGGRMRIGNLTLRGNDDDSDRNACFGMLFTTSQFVGHQVERVMVNYVDTALGLLQGTGANGEQTRVSRFFGNQVRRAYYSNAPQAFEQEFDGWNMAIADRDPDADPLPDQIFAEFAQMPAPGVGVNFINAHCTFGGGENLEGRGILVKIRRGTGILQFNGGRMEHLGRLFDYDAIDGQGSRDDLDCFIRGMEFDGVRGGADRAFVFGDDAGGTPGTNYGLFVTDCTFRGKSGAEPEDTDLRFETKQKDNVRCIFERCRFIGLRSFQMTNFRADFSRCYRNDYSVPGGTEAFGPARQFNQTSGAPQDRTQSMRTGWQDTPWVQTGPRTNIMGFSDFAGQAKSSGPDSGVAFNSGGAWEIVGDTDLAGFGKWGAFSGSDDANISPSPEAFYISLLPGTRVQNVIDAIDLSLPKVVGLDEEPASKVVTFQCLCQVRGKARFVLVRKLDSFVDTGQVFDELTVESPDPAVFTEPMLVTLRAQVYQFIDLHFTYAVVCIENPEPVTGECSLRVLWQQVWGGTEATDEAGEYPLAAGLANAGQARVTTTEPVKNTYNWAVNALGIKAASKFQLPNLDTIEGGDAAGMGWLSPSDLDVAQDLEDGAMYHDQSQFAVLGRCDELWYTFVQPERFHYHPGDVTWVGGTAKNLVYDEAASHEVTLSTNLALVPRGSMVRVFNFRTSVGTLYPITVKVGSSTLASVSNSLMAEFLFWVDDTDPDPENWVGRWVVVQKSLATGYLPTI
ncbi:MAG: hypothetical protein JST30_17250 [Armatimonadetes bacterium]|nr:hypothetical protein [Armatimonadota bacterium]